MLRSAQVHDRYTNYSRVIKKLKALDMLDDDFNVQTKRGWIFRPLAECRRNWEDRNRGSGSGTARWTAFSPTGPSAT